VPEVVEVVDWLAAIERRREMERREVYILFENMRIRH